MNKYSYNMKQHTYQLIASDKNMEGCVLIEAYLLLTPELPQDSTIFNVSPVGKSLELRDEACDFLLPVMQCRSRGYD